MRTIIATTFHHGFSIKNTDGTIRRFGICEHHDDVYHAIKTDGNKFYLIRQLDVHDEHSETSEPLPLGTQYTFGYHDNEHGDWQSL